MTTRASTKTEIIERLAVKTHLPRRDAERVWAALVEIVRENIEEGRNLSFAPVGLLKVKKLPPRQAFAPQAGRKVDVPARHAVSFQLSRDFDRTLREMIAEKHETIPE
ncbi:HU family DNA-binding protein [Hyphomicrobium sp.]|jgi:nucleoid DNA-binding protein|uniref:HU family DNA-binding protein n=1 Tax=Hyphomicrobium sp. TaxID=82 RepID=UPI002FE34CAD